MSYGHVGTSYSLLIVMTFYCVLFSEWPLSKALQYNSFFARSVEIANSSPVCITKFPYHVSKALEPLFVPIIVNRPGHLLPVDRASRYSHTGTPTSSSRSPPLCGPVVPEWLCRHLSVGNPVVVCVCK